MIYDKNGCHNGHRNRLRERYANFGADSFEQHELLEILLFYGIPRKNTNEIAHDLLTRFGSIHGILQATKKELCTVPGIGPSAADFIRLFGEISREYEERSSSDTDTTKSSAEYTEIFRDFLKHLPAKTCMLICPGTSFNISFCKDEIFSGNFDFVSLMNILVKRGCDRVVIGISPVANSLIPEKQDVSLAETFRKKLGSLGIELIDCIIVGETGSFSVLYDGAFKI